MKKIEGIVGVYQVYGVFDVIVEVEAESDKKLKKSYFRNSHAQARTVYAHAYHDTVTSS